MPTRVIDRGFHRRVQALREAGRLVGRAGVFSDGKGATRYPNGMTAVEVMAIHEFGAPTVGIPRRSVVEHIGRAYAEQDHYDMRMAIQQMHAQNSAAPVRQMLKQIVDRAAERMADYVRDPATPPPPNALATVRAKGFDNPLFHHGTLADAFEGRVEIRNNRAGI